MRVQQCRIQQKEKREESRKEEREERREKRREEERRAEKRRVEYGWSIKRIKAITLAAITTLN